MLVAVIVTLVVYLLVDIGYITLAKPLYAAAVQKVQGGVPMGPVPLWFALGAYSALLTGWWVLVGSRITAETTFWEAAVWGMTFGSCVYGVFNYTVAAMFQEYRGRVVIQDLVWGTVAGTAISLFYLYLLKQSGRP